MAISGLLWPVFRSLSTSFSLGVNRENPLIFGTFRLKKIGDFLIIEICKHK
jgi:hypothetical protein